MRYKCNVKCFYKNRLFTVGEVLNVEKSDPRPPKHFVPANKFKAKVVDPVKADQEAMRAVGHEQPSNKKDEEDFLL